MSLSLLPIIPPMKRPIAFLATLAVVLAYGQGALSQASGMPDWQKFLDQYYPFIEQGAEPPGHFAPSGKPGLGQIWQGKTGWRTRHGQAVLVWSLGKPSSVENALYPDGTRGEANHTLDHGFRRRATGERLWAYGRIDIRPDDVVFVDGEQPIYWPPPQGDVPNLEADLARDPEFVTAMRDDRFALAVLTVFDNRSFYKGQDRRAWEFGSRQVARLVADLHGKGESYHDYFPQHGFIAGTYPDDRPDVEQKLQSKIDTLANRPAFSPGVTLEQLAAWLGPGQHSPEEVREAMERMRPWLERQRPADLEQQQKQQQAELERAKQELASFRDNHDNDDVLGLLRAHLGRLGWRTETEADRQRVHQEWVARAVEVLKEVQDLERRPATPPQPWTERLQGPQKAWRGLPVETLDKMSPDMRAVETGELERRLRGLALTGRVSEPEYLALVERSSPAAAKRWNLTGASPSPMPADPP